MGIVVLTLMALIVIAVCVYTVHVERGIKQGLSRTGRKLWWLVAWLFVPRGPKGEFYDGSDLDRTLGRTTMFQRFLQRSYVPSKRQRIPIPEDIRQAVYRRDGGRCKHCGNGLGLEIDHIHPFSRGGSNDISNLQLLCRRCNVRKGNRFIGYSGLQ